MTITELRDLIAEHAINLRPNTLHVENDMCFFIVDEMYPHHVTAHIDDQGRIVENVDDATYYYTRDEYIVFLGCVDTE